MKVIQLEKEHHIQGEWQLYDKENDPRWLPRTSVEVFEMGIGNNQRQFKVLIRMAGEECEVISPVMKASVNDRLMALQQLFDTVARMIGVSNLHLHEREVKNAPRKTLCPPSPKSLKA